MPPQRSALNVVPFMGVPDLRGKFQERYRMPFSCTFSCSVSVVCLQVNKGVQAQAIFFKKPDSQHSLERKAENTDQRMREFQGTGDVAS